MCILLADTGLFLKISKMANISSPGGHYVSALLSPD